MKHLTEQDIQTLKRWGYSDKDISQIDYAVGKSVYHIVDNNKRRISSKKAREILGDKEFLSGISRSAFHFNAVRGEEKGILISFDSSVLFK